MGKRKGKSSTSTKVSSSSGRRRMSRAKRALLRVTMKISRWKRYIEEEKPSVTVKQRKSKKHKNKSRHNNWDITGLERHAKLLKSIVDMGRKVKRL
jgi:hypothetical protein